VAHPGSYGARDRWTVRKASSNWTFRGDQVATSGQHTFKVRVTILESPCIFNLLFGAARGIRTPDPIITNDAQLSKLRVAVLYFINNKLNIGEGSRLFAQVDPEKDRTM
jgi:hypothetical protein